MTMHSPVFEGPLSQNTEVKIFYNSTHIFMAASMFDTEPEKIQAAGLYRDGIQMTNDWIGILLDSYNDKENFLCFFTNPEGVRTDFVIYNDAEGPMPFQISWNAFWDVEVIRNELGWTAEYRIPLSSLRFQVKNNTAVMGLNVQRYIPRYNEFQSFPSIDPKWGPMAVSKPSKAREVMFTNITSKTPIYITPYALGGYEMLNELNDNETYYIKEEEFVKSIGLDLKYGITSNLTMDLTVNTDFAQVEADDLQVNLTRFSLFFPEKRLFFQERASMFDFNTGGPNRVFYSRKIGIDDDGNPVDIYAGVRMVGRIGKWDLGFLDMQTAESDSLPSENFGVLRLRQQVFNENSYMGGIFTSRIGVNGDQNFVAGLDGIIRLFDDDYLTYNFVQTFETGIDPSIESSLIRAEMNSRNREGFGYEIGISRTGEDYNPGIGFVHRTGAIRLGDRLFYGWLPGESSSLIRHIISLEANGYVNNKDGFIESAIIGPSWDFEYKSGSFGKFSLQYNREELTEEFELTDDIDVPIGKYSFIDFTGMYATPMGSLFRSDFAANFGGFFDGWRISAAAKPTWSISKHLELGLGYEFNHVEFEERNDKLTAHIGRIRALFMFDTKFSARAFVQYDSFDDIMVINFRLRYNWREGNDIYLVYNEGVNTDRFNRTPYPPVTDNRTLLLKFTYTFTSEL